MWARISRMMSDSLAHKAMVVQRDMLRNNNICWLYHLKSTLTSTPYGSNIWHQWWNRDVFGSVDCTRIYVDNLGKRCVAKWEDECLLSLQENAINVWRTEVNQVEAKTGVGLNKLRTDKRVLLSKFRIGICPLYALRLVDTSQQVV